MIREMIYIHVDKRAVNCPFESIESSVRKAHLFWTKQQCVNWGGIPDLCGIVPVEKGN